MARGTKSELSVEALCRDAAKAAGFDPDERVSRVNAKPWPRWCEFRADIEANLSAIRAKEAAAVIAEAAIIVPQAPEYQNSPLRVYGDHDENTLTQMRSCMSTGNVVVGVICADGHVGYAQPVGGVIAYENQVSISGVGFDIGCFTGDTKIYTLDGKHPNISEVVGKDIFVLANDENGNVVPAKAIGVKTRINASLVEVAIDNNTTIRCTPDQKFKLLNGEYKEAQALSPGDRLMPLYWTTDTDGYVVVRKNMRNTYLSRLQTMIYKAGLLDSTTVQLLSEDDDIVTHHINQDLTNNDPSNLKPMSRITHAQYHMSQRDLSYMQTDEFKSVANAGARKFWETAKNDEEFLERRNSARMDADVIARENNPQKYIDAVKDNGKRGANFLRKYNTDPETIRKNKEKAGTKILCFLCGEEIPAASSGIYFHAKEKHPEALKETENFKNIRLPLREKLIMAAVNHKVVSVTVLNEQEDVYCLQVPNYNNFALLNGVFVHNCGNMAVELDVTYGDIKDRMADILSNVRKHVSFGVGRVNDTPVKHDLFDDSEAWRAADMEDYFKKAKSQLGTVGSGNHYVDIMVDTTNHDPAFSMDNCRVWIGVHFGSRGLGHTSATKYLKAAGGKDGMYVAPAVVDVSSEIGERYLAAMNLAGRYAYAGREWVVERVRQLTGGNVLQSIHNHHNYCVAGSQIIQTKFGPKRMDEINTDDVIYAFDTEKGVVETNVVKHWKSGKKKIYKISTRSRSVRVSGDHLIQVVSFKHVPHVKYPWKNSKEIDYKWIKAEDIKKTDILVCCQNFYDRIDSKDWDLDKARLVGAFLGDGWMGQKTGYNLGLAIGELNDPHTDRYLDLLKRIWPTSYWSNNTPGAFGLTASNKIIHSWFKNLGKLGLRSVSRRLPFEIFQLPYDLKMACIAGYFDADGSVESPGIAGYAGRGSATANNRFLIEDMRELILSCGLSCTNVSTRFGTSNFSPKGFWCSNISIAARDMAKVPLWHERKIKNLRPENPVLNRDLYKLLGVKLPDNTFAQKVISIEIESEEEDVYDLEVDHPSHSFVAGGIVVHNCWLEQHNGKNLYVVRKGATPAFPGQFGFIGGSMGDDCVIVEGVDSVASAEALYSTIHGAGRLYSRTAAKKQFTREQMDAWLRDRMVIVSGGDVDEAPMSYRRLPEVLKYHEGTIKVKHNLRPVAVAMAGQNEMDPWKD